MTDAHTKIENAEHRLREGLDTVRDTAAKVYHDAGDKAAERSTRRRKPHVAPSTASNPTRSAFSSAVWSSVRSRVC
ncbi:hypothetical protein [Sphingomonas sp. Ant20]|uniref:hypothetical protein n=1 Tax=Sphingomonas sp. Ant20 TaxID=104605 RepID=UPI000536D2F1|nr:hypothetical protein [Sphingomonas sp. Ant20]KHA63089.1 hypothetical protein NI18_18605 [Sphingomonas sp. Ant20]